MEFIRGLRLLLIRKLIQEEDKERSSPVIVQVRLEKMKLDSSH
jgi:hypothetical protein